MALFLWEQRREEEQMQRVARDETLSRLPLRLQSGRVVELVALRGTTRPVSCCSQPAMDKRAGLVVPSRGEMGAS